jgi:glucokinase
VEARIVMAGNPFYIGIDLGGTTFKALAVTSDGQILAHRSGQSTAGGGVRTVIMSIVQTVAALRSEMAVVGHHLAAVGLGMAGIIELPGGIVRRAPNLPNWSGIDVRELLGQYLDVSFAMENDANVALLGEAWMGAARGLQHVVMMPLGTGVGGAVMIDGVILHGAKGFAGEIGHTVVEPHGRPCVCGSYGCLEQYVSGTAIARLAQPHYGTVTSEAVAQAAQRGEAEALAIFQRVGWYLGIACANMAQLFNPQCIVIGGGVGEAFDLFREPLQRVMRERTMPEVYEQVRVVPAACGPIAGSLGAAYHAMREVGE